MQANGRSRDAGRSVRAGLGLWLLTALADPPAAAGEVDDTPDLAATPYIDVAHPQIVATARRLVEGATDDRTRAIRIHDFVRDQITFGWTPSFYDQKASAVLASGRGYCHTKTTLFVALMRAADIPARMRFVDLDARILDGLIDPGTPFVDHSFAEVRIDGRLLRVDSYVVDRQLAERARARLAEEGRMLGWGVHRNGVSDWQGDADAFSQFVDDGSVTVLSIRDHGVFADVGAFYASGLGLNRLNAVTRSLFRWFARGANARTDRLRQHPGDI